MKAKELKRLTKDEIKHIRNSLPYGAMTELSFFLGCSTTTVSNLLKEKRIYDYEAKEMVDVYQMPTDTYYKIIAFLKMIHE